MKVALILSGCGHLDGSEIRETVLSLLYLDQAHMTVTMFAPNSAQHHVVRHRTGEEMMSEQRSVLEEAARLARGAIATLEELTIDAYDALIIPGGFGVAKNLSDLAFAGASMRPHPLFASIVRGFYEARKPIGAICIAPVVLSSILHDRGITLTLGSDEPYAAMIRQHGNVHHTSPTHRAVVDSRHRIASCSAYMRDDAPIHEVAQGIEDVVRAIKTMIQESPTQVA